MCAYTNFVLLDPFLTNTFLLFLETGLFRLLGHSAPISDISFVPTSSDLQSLNGLVTSSFDGLVKVWDLDAQCCVQTIANHGDKLCAPQY
jgi:U3 small nucleolar RNA-associated protein 12